MSSKGVLQECHLSASNQGVPQVGSLEYAINKYCLCSSTYVSAFGFVGFILRFFLQFSLLGFMDLDTAGGPSFSYSFFLGFLGPCFEGVLWGANNVLGRCR